MSEQQVLAHWPQPLTVGPASETLGKKIYNWEAAAFIDNAVDVTHLFFSLCGNNTIILITKADNGDGYPTFFIVRHIVLADWEHVSMDIGALLGRPRASTSSRLFRNAADAWRFAADAIMAFSHQS